MPKSCLYIQDYFMSQKVIHMVKTWTFLINRHFTTPHVLVHSFWENFYIFLFSIFPMPLQLCSPPNIKNGNGQQTTSIIIRKRKTREQQQQKATMRTKRQLNDIEIYLHTNAIFHSYHTRHFCYPSPKQRFSYMCILT